MFKPSPYQKAIFDFVASGRGSAKIEAVAGSGKTTTIVKALELIPPYLKVAFLAFNRSIAQELKKLVPGHVQACTLNSLGHRAWTKHVGKVCQLDANKTRAILDAIVESSGWDGDTYGKFRENRSEITKMVALAKAHGLAPSGCGLTGLVPDDIRSWLDLIDHHNLDVEEEDIHFVIETARQALKVSVRKQGLIDFDDQLYMTVLYNVPMFRFDVIFVDEAQDLSPIQHALLRKALKPGGRLIAVGDPRQAIYGFRGADAESMARLGRDFGCVNLPLSISYRCPQNVVMYAQQIVSHIEAAPSAPEGEVISLPHYDAQDFNAEDLIICRNTAPVVEMAYALIRRRVPVRVLGREIGQGLVALINRLDRRKSGRNIHGEKGLVERLDRWRQRETEKYVAKGDDAKAEAVADKAETLQVMIEESDVETAEDLIREIEQLFSDDKKEILTLSTVHKAKGLEAPRVFVLEPDLMPSKYARKEWQIEQEKNLMYVAYTRAKQTLVFIRLQDFGTKWAIEQPQQTASAA